MREERNQLLKDSDYTALPDYPNRDAWLDYRQQLRDFPSVWFDQRQAQWRIDLFWQQLQALSARSCRSLARNLHSSGYTQSTCSQGGGPCEKRWRTTTTSVRGV